MYDSEIQQQKLRSHNYFLHEMHSLLYLHDFIHWNLIEVSCVRWYVINIVLIALTRGFFPSNSKSHSGQFLPLNILLKQKASFNFTWAQQTKWNNRTKPIKKSYQASIHWVPVCIPYLYEKWRKKRKKK